LVVAVLVVVSVVGAYLYLWLDREILSTLPEDLSQYRTWRPPTTCRVYAADGSLVDEFYVERRVWVDLDTLPEHVWRAFLVAEDRRFFDHPGVDLFGIARAALENWRAGETVQGGSTLTQQLVKNLMVGDEVSYERKLKEAILAYRLERELGKEAILELYLNYVYLGSGNYGVQAAATDYFGVDAAALDPGQAALIAGLIPAPSRYSPRTHPENARWRRAVVIRAMVDENVIDAVDAIDYLADPVQVVVKKPPISADPIAYVTQVRREVRRLVGEQLAYTQGLRVYTALDPAVQHVATEAVRKALVALDQRQGRRSVLRTLEPEALEAFLAAESTAPPDAAAAPVAEGECFEAVVGRERDLGRLHTGQGTVALAKADWTVLQHQGEEKEAIPLSRRVKPGDVLRLCPTEDGSVVLDPHPWGQGAAVVLENGTGRVIALVGGYEVGLEGFVRATQARRQPGSSFKPYVYAAALRNGHTQLDVVSDLPIALPGGGGRIWSPKNYGGGYAGAMRLRSALARSINTIAVRMALEVGPAEVARTARAMGVATPLRTDITIALGSSEVTPMDQALGYATIARMGVPVQPAYVDRLEDVDGVVLGERGGPIRVDGAVVGELPGAPLPRALEPGIAYELLDMMREVVRSGTARRALRPGFDRGGKTGTTNDFIDAWFVGFTPRYTVAVWVGSDGTTSLGDRETGARAALPAWIEIVEALPAEEGERFAIPDEAVLVRTEEGWVGLPRGTAARGGLAWRDVRGAPLPEFRLAGPQGIPR